jgi:GT2 family glycosyltransferase
LDTLNKNDQIGVVIVNYNTYEKTCECIKSIFSTTNIVKTIVIIDNGSTNDSIKCLNGFFHLNNKVKIIELEKNLGYAKAIKIGIDYLSKVGLKYALLSNNDIIYLENSIDNLLIPFQDKNVAISGPKIYNSNNILQHSTSLSEPKFREMFGIKTNKKYIDENYVKIPIKVYAVSGCAFMISISIFIMENLPDERTFLYNEENIMAYKLELKNYLTIFQPNSNIIHDHGYTSGKSNMFVNKEYLISSVYYWRYYRRISTSKIFVLFIFLTFKWMIKSLYTKSMRKGWIAYLKGFPHILKK